MDICVFGDSLPSPYFHTVTLTARYQMERADLFYQILTIYK